MPPTKLYNWIILLLVLAIGMWWLSAFQYTMKWDIMDITLPWQYFVGESLNIGELPLWNPFVKNGFPQMGLPDTWYPISWIISLVFGVDVWSIQLSYLLHLLIAGVGMYKYLSHKVINLEVCLALAVCYMFSGVMIGNAQHLGWIIGAAWLPWVFYYFDKLFVESDKLDTLKMALVGSLLFYGAYPPITIIIFYVLLIKLGFNLWDKSVDKIILTKLAGAGVLLLLLSAVGLIGMLDVTPHLNRGEALPLSDEGWGVLTGHFPLKAIGSLVIPYAGNAIKGFWGSDISLINVYCGFIPLLLLGSIVWTRSTKAIKYSLIGFLFLAIGMSDVFPLRAWLYYLPLFDRFRFPSLFRLFFIFFLLTGIAYAWKALQKEEAISQKKIIMLILWIAGILIVILLGFSVSRTEANPFQILSEGGLFNLNLQGGYHEKAIINLVIHFILIVGLVIFSYSKINVLRLLPFFIIAEVLMISQFNISETVIHNADPSIGNAEINGFDNKPINIDLEKPMNGLVDGYWDDQLSRFRYNQACITKTPSPSGNSPFSLKAHKAAIKNNDISINENPLFFFGDISQDNVVAKAQDGTIEIVKATSQSFEVRVNCEEPSNLIFLQNYYPGWRVTKNKEEVEIQKINTSFMSVPVESGTHVLNFIFRPKKMIYSFYISLLSFAFTISGIVYLSIKRRKSS